jgi:hypothetical protein
MAGWVVTVTGPTTMSTTTDANGNYLFNSLASGTYLVCEQLQSGWSEVFPTSAASCATGLGYDFTVDPGQTAEFVEFHNQLML